MRQIGPWIVALTAVSVSPAWASFAQELPEPSMLGLVALGVAGAIVAARLKLRK